MRPSTASRHLGAAKVLELLLSIDRARARIVRNHQIGGHPIPAASAGRVTIVPNEEALVRHAFLKSRNDTGRDDANRLAPPAPLSSPFHSATDSPEART